MSDPGKPASGDVENGKNIIYNSNDEKAPLVPPVDPMKAAKRKSYIIFGLTGALVLSLMAIAGLVVIASS
eukprot:8186657-Pyramimonas_sp.AAC.1